MRLIVDKEELQYLTDNHVLKQGGNPNEYYLYLHDNGITELEHVVVTVEGEEFEKKEPGVDINELYKRYMHAFPTDINKELGSSTKEGICLRTGSPKKIIPKLKAYLNEGMSIDDIVLAVRYNIWFVKNMSTVDNNKLEYIKRAESWINDRENLVTMIERSKNSKEFQNHLIAVTNKTTGNGENESGLGYTVSML